MNDKIKNKKILNVPHLRFKEFSGEWKRCKIGKILKIKSGKDQKAVEKPNGKYNIYGTGGIIGKTDAFLYDKESIGIGRKGTIDRPFYFNQPFWTVDTLFYSEIKKDHCVKFIYYIFETINWKMYDESTGVPSLSSSTIESIGVYVSNKKEQQKISDFLTLIDKRIETQMKIIKEIESLKNSIVIKIFGDKSKFLNKWAKNKLSDILKERKQYAQKGSKYTHVTLSKEGVVNKTDRYNRDFLVKDEEKEYKVTKLNDICYNPANLKFGVICLNKYGDAIFSPIYVTYEINKNYNPLFIELALTNSTFIGHIRKYEQGTVYERMAVSSEDFLKGTIITPPFEDQNNIVKAFNIIDGKLEIEKSILDKLKLQKNYLLNNMFV